MITVSNGVENFTIRKEMIKKVERGIRVSPDDYYCNIEFLLEGKCGFFKSIIKKLPPDSGDELKTYLNLNYRLKNEIILSNDDYVEVKRLYENMQLDKTIRKNAIVISAANLFAYECFKNYCIEELDEVQSEEMFEEIVRALNEYRELQSYKDEIYELARKILKDEYKVENII